MLSFTCVACRDRERGKTYNVKEMMFGVRDEYTYDECAKCGSIQISPIPSPEVLAKAYSGNYYSFSKDGQANSGRARLKALFETIRDRGAYGTSPLGALVQKLKPDSGVLSLLRSIGVRPEQRILDVGCGAGVLINRLARIGFGDVSGVDPFLNSDGATRDGARLYKRTLAEASGPFDVTMFNHSFEHLLDPGESLKTAWEKLAPGGLCLVRTPTPSSQAWEEYGVNWAQWDAPRHISLMSRQGFSNLAMECGFRLVKIVDDAGPWSMMASELYKRGIALHDVRFEEQFSRSEMAAFEQKTRAANAAGRGDSVAYVLEKQ